MAALVECDDHFALGAARFEIGHGFVQRLETKHLVDDGPDGAGFDQSGDLFELGATAVHEQKRVANAGLCRLFANATTDQSQDQPDDGIELLLPANSGSGGPEIETATPPLRTMRKDFSSVSVSWLLSTKS